MSAAHDAHAETSAGHHDAHDHFDNEPATELGADETRTAAWVPYLGLALFFLAGLTALLGSDDDKATADKPAAAQAQAAPEAAAPPIKMPEIQARPAVPLQPGQPGTADPNPLKRLSPEQAKELQKLIEQRRQQGGAPGQPGAPPQPGAVPQPPVPQPNPVH
jgi:hypothetical protein